MAAKFNTLRTACLTAARDGVVPGLVVAVGRGGRTLFHEAFGAATTDTIYDLASLTKALATSVVAIQAVSRGLIALDDPVARHCPPWRGPGKESVTLRQVLAHSSGLPAHRPFYAALGKMPGDGNAPADGRAHRAAVVTAAAAEPLVYMPGTQSLYSDLGFIVLGDVLERAFGERLDVLTQRFVTGPLRLDGAASGVHVQLGFIDLDVARLANAPAVWPDPIVAPTEDCPVRKRIVVGQVHDLNAFAMGGIAGHAGLFGTASAVAAVARALCGVWAGDASAVPLVPRSLLQSFWTSAGIPGSTWRLGWDGPTDQGSAAGNAIARSAVGHLGFTGCSVWIDPVSATFVVMLSNRVHPSAAENPDFRALRPALHDAALHDAGLSDASLSVAAPPD